MEKKNRIKQLSNDIKVLIITALIVSCVGVYAAGVCIVSVTSEDVAYNNTTVKTALDELYNLARNHCPNGFVCNELNYVINCDNDKIHTTIPDNLSGLAKKMAQNAYLDNGQSQYVNSCSGVDFSDISSNRNGKGIYEIASTKDDEYPIYYYRGEVDNNNVLFGGFCWKAIRTTDTGGVKMIYNGVPSQSGNCFNSTGTNTQIGGWRFNQNFRSLSSTGYMFTSGYDYISESSSNLNTPYVYGNDVTYSDGLYTLTNTMTSSGNWEDDYDQLDNNHYTCLSTSDNCSTVYYIFHTDTVYASFIPLANGKKVEDALDEMFTNTSNSEIKNYIDNWYGNYLSNYHNYIEDTVYCNDRTIHYYAGWNPNGGNNTEDLSFNANYRLATSFEPTLTCSRMEDRFTISLNNGNGALIFPVGLLTVDEMMYAGGRYNTDNPSYFLYTNQQNWTMSPSGFYYYNYNGYAYEIYMGNTGVVYSWVALNSASGVRPVISLAPTAIVKSGNGTTNTPYVIQTS